MSDKYAAIAAHTDQYPVQLMCAAQDVSTSGYYAAVARASAPPTPRALRRARRRELVRATLERCRRHYGAPRLVRELRAEGHCLSQKTGARLLREDGLAARRPQPWVCTTDSAHGEPIAENLLARQFAPATCPTLNTVWVGDMTYIPTRAGWLYLAVLLDLASRCVVGWAVRTTLATALPVAALQRALAWRQPSRGLTHHTDRGSQYASREYRTVLATHGMQCSMSRRGDCWDNAVAEGSLRHSNTNCWRRLTFTRIVRPSAPLLTSLMAGTIPSDGIQRSAMSVRCSMNGSSVNWREQHKPCVRFSGSSPG
jgi:putative transposase